MVVTVPNSGYPDNPYGTTIFQSSSTGNKVPAQLIADCKDLGYTWLRYNSRWDNFESSPGVFNWLVGDDLVAQANAAKLNLLWEIDCNMPPAFRQNQACSATGFLPSASDVATYATAISSRYNGTSGHGLIQAVGIGQEGYDLVANDSVSTTTNYGVAYTYFPCKDPVWYAPVLAMAAPIIRANIPGVMIGSAAQLDHTYTRAARFMQTLLDYGLYQYLDFIQYHWYAGNRNPPTNSPDSDHRNFDQMRQVLQQGLINARVNMPIDITECGYATNALYGRSSGDVVDFETQINFETQEYEFSRRSQAIRRHYRFTLNYNNAESANSDGMSLVQGSLDQRTTVPWYSGVKNYIQQYPQW